MSDIMEDAKSKENNSPQGMVTPTRQQKVTGLNSPAQSKALWDSSDPMRNPPPLPLSPHMLRTATNKVKTSNPSSPVGKLQFAAVDTTEIEYQLQRVLEAQNSLKSLLQGIDVSVKQTQMDLDNLHQRSANNNSHLKNLLENVSTSALTPLPTLSSEDLQKALAGSEKVISEKFEKIEDLKREIIAGLGDIFNSTAPKPDKDELVAELTEIKAQLTTIISNSQSETFEKIGEQLKSNLKAQENTRELVASNNDALSDSVKQLHRKVDAFEISEKMVSLNEHQTNVQQKIQNIFDLLSKLQLSEDSLKAFSSSLDTVIKAVQSLEEKSLEKFAAVSQSHEVSEKINGLDEVLHQLIVADEGKFSCLTDKISNVEIYQKDFIEKSDSLETLGNKLTEIIGLRFANIDASIDDLKKKLDNRSGALAKAELEKKDLSLALKDKEISELKLQLEEEKAKSQINSTLSELKEQKAKIEAKMEGLKEIYKVRYDELKSLANEHQQFTLSLHESNSDKLKSIVGAASFVQMTLDASTPELQSCKKSGAMGTRVLSTNSYLGNKRNTLSPRSRKKYDLVPLDDEESEKENV